MSWNLPVLTTRWRQNPVQSVRRWRRTEGGRNSLHQAQEWDCTERTKRPSKSKSPSVDAKCYFMFHETWPPHLGWTRNTAWHPSGLLKMLEPVGGSLCTSPFLSTLRCTAITADQLCGPWGRPPPTTTTTSETTGLPTAAESNQHYMLSIFAQKAEPRSEKGPSSFGLQTSLLWDWDKCHGSAGKAEGQEAAGYSPPPQLQTWRSPGCLFLKSHQ